MLECSRTGSGDFSVAVLMMMVMMMLRMRVIKLVGIREIASRFTAAFVVKLKKQATHT